VLGQECAAFAAATFSTDSSAADWATNRIVQKQRRSTEIKGFVQCNRIVTIQVHISKSPKQRLLSHYIFPDFS
jgi:hypothetical protein